MWHETFGVPGAQSAHRIAYLRSRSPTEDIKVIEELEKDAERVQNAVSAVPLLQRMPPNLCRLILS